MAPVDLSVRLPAMTWSAPHVRDAISVRTAMIVFMVSLIPPTVMAVYNTGYQANLAMERLGVGAAPGWRGQLIDLLGNGYDVSTPVAAVVHGAVYFLPALLVVIAAAAIWTWLFAMGRGRRMGPGVFGIALVVTLMLPPTMPLWLAALGMSFGIVLGREIFGGFGRNVLNPAVVALAFLHVAYPVEMMADWVWVPVEGYAGATPLELARQGGLATLAKTGVTWMDAFLGNIPGGFGETSALAAVIGAALLLWTGLASWRVIAGIVLGAVATAMAFGVGGDGNASIFALPWAWHLVLGSVAFGAVYMASDPVTAAATDTGRWIYGLLIGVLAIIIRVAGPAHAEGMVFAVLLGNIFAPAIDHAVMWANIRRRARRHAR
ncbi:MAG: NADH:ubiquinone reductase (Na(+)-transporting) subunit B [Aestuariivirga sp.]|nr:NADH:ubiquinone reductase (Na(+)-transporting) subunit B [Aestuariivirga sp.]